MKTKLLAAAYYFAKQCQLAPEVTAAITDAIDTATETVANTVGLSMWSPEKIPAQYANTISQTESANGLPENMLARLLWQESRYNAAMTA